MKEGPDLWGVQIHCDIVDSLFTRASSRIHPNNVITAVQPALSHARQRTASYASSAADTLMGVNFGGNWLPSRVWH
jgi:hypothetical protein